MNKERLSRLITQYQKNLEFYRNAREFNEQDCRDEFISPLLESFGWDVHNEKGTSPQYKEVVVEKFSNSGDRPDYTLTLNGVSKIFVEAKKPAVNIKEESEPAIQARRYGWNAKHKLSILTNFEDMMIYDVTNKPQDGDAATVSLYRKYHYLEYLKKYEEIYELISRETHNPNIAVACDAEQIICCKMDKNTHKITYLSGAIEDQEIKQNVVDILEGTMPAFDLRRRKYV